MRRGGVFGDLPGVAVFRVRGDHARAGDAIAAAKVEYLGQDEAGGRAFGPSLRLFGA